MYVIVFGKNSFGWNIYLAEVIDEKILDRTVCFKTAKKFSSKHDAEKTIEKFQELKNAYIKSEVELKKVNVDSYSDA